MAPTASGPDHSAHRCDKCGKQATHCYREGSGTGHSEHVCACSDHGEDPVVMITEALRLQR